MSSIKMRKYKIVIFVLYRCGCTVAFVFYMILGNLEAKDNGYNHGLNEIGSTLHWGPDAAQNRWPMTHGTK